MQDGGTSGAALEAGHPITVPGPTANGSAVAAAAAADPLAAAQTPVLPAPVDEGSSLLGGHDDDDGSDVLRPASAANSYSGARRAYLCTQPICSKAARICNSCKPCSSAVVEQL